MKGFVPFLVPEWVPETVANLAAKTLYWKEHNGRFWARMAVPKDLQKIIGRSEIIIPLGGDLRLARRAHAAAAAQLQARIEAARSQLTANTPVPLAVRTQRPLAQFDCENAARAHYEATLGADDQKRLELPTQAAIETEYEKLMQRIDAGEGDISHGLPAAINLQTDYELACTAREHYANLRERRLRALRQRIADFDTRLVDDQVKTYVARHAVDVAPNSPGWRKLGLALLRAEVDALERTLERDQGRYDGSFKDPILTPPAQSLEDATPVPLMTLFEDYIAARQAHGKHRDGAKAWERAMSNLISFLGNNDARRITKRQLLDWRDNLLKNKNSPKTIANVYLASIRAVLKWAYENARLELNEGETVRQEVPKKIRNRETGYTDDEAVKVLKASIRYQPTPHANPSNRESAHITAAKRWIPLLCAFTGARVTEMAQLRKEDVRKEGDRWVIRIAPVAGSVKSKEYRDAPLHRQVIALGFVEFRNAAEAGPLFHRGQDPATMLKSARATSGRLSEWLQEAGLVPDEVQPSHGWRHRFKTVGLELGLSDRIIDAIQGHAPRTAGEHY